MSGKNSSLLVTAKQTIPTVAPFGASYAVNSPTVNTNTSTGTKNNQKKTKRVSWQRKFKEITKTLKEEFDPRTHKEAWVEFLKTLGVGAVSVSAAFGMLFGSKHIRAARVKIGEPFGLSGEKGSYNKAIEKLAKKTSLGSLEKFPIVKSLIKQNRIELEVLRNQLTSDSYFDNSLLSQRIRKLEERDKFLREEAIEYSPIAIFIWFQTGLSPDSIESSISEFHKYLDPNNPESKITFDFIKEVSKEIATQNNTSALAEKDKGGINFFNFDSEGNPSIDPISLLRNLKEGVNRTLETTVGDLTPKSLLELLDPTEQLTLSGLVERTPLLKLTNGKALGFYQEQLKREGLSTSEIEKTIAEAKEDPGVFIEGLPDALAGHIEARLNERLGGSFKTLSPTSIGGETGERSTNALTSFNQEKTSSLSTKNSSIEKSDRPSNSRSKNLDDYLPKKLIEPLDDYLDNLGNSNPDDGSANLQKRFLTLFCQSRLNPEEFGEKTLATAFPQELGTLIETLDKTIQELNTPTNHSSTDISPYEDNRSSTDQEAKSILRVLTGVREALETASQVQFKAVAPGLVRILKDNKKKTIVDLALHSLWMTGKKKEAIILEAAVSSIKDFCSEKITSYPEFLGSFDENINRIESYINPEKAGNIEEGISTFTLNTNLEESSAPGLSDQEKAELQSVVDSLRKIQERLVKRTQGIQTIDELDPLLASFEQFYGFAHLDTLLRKTPSEFLKELNQKKEFIDFLKSSNCLPEGEQELTKENIYQATENLCSLFSSFVLNIHFDVGNLLKETINFEDETPIVDQVSKNLKEIFFPDLGGTSDSSKNEKSFIEDIGKFLIKAGTTPIKETVKSNFIQIGDFLIDKAIFPLIVGIALQGGLSTAFLKQDDDSKKAKNKGVIEKKSPDQSKAIDLKKSNKKQAKQKKDSVTLQEEKIKGKQNFVFQFIENAFFAFLGGFLGSEISHGFKLKGAPRLALISAFSFLGLMALGGFNKFTEWLYDKFKSMFPKKQRDTVWLKTLFEMSIVTIVTFLLYLKVLFAKTMKLSMGVWTGDRKMIMAGNLAAGGLSLPSEIMMNLANLTVVNEVDLFNRRKTPRGLHQASINLVSGNTTDYTYKISREHPGFLTWMGLYSKDKDKDGKHKFISFIDPEIQSVEIQNQDDLSRNYPEISFFNSSILEEGRVLPEINIRLLNPEKNQYKWPKTQNPAELKCEIEYKNGRKVQAFRKLGIEENLDYVKKLCQEKNPDGVWGAKFKLDLFDPNTRFLHVFQNCRDHTEQVANQIAQKNKPIGEILRILGRILNTYSDYPITALTHKKGEKVKPGFKFHLSMGADVFFKLFNHAAVLVFFKALAFPFLYTFNWIVRKLGMDSAYQQSKNNISNFSRKTLHKAPALTASS